MHPQQHVPWLDVWLGFMAAHGVRAWWVLPLTATIWVRCLRAASCFAVPCCAVPQVASLQGRIDALYQQTFGGMSVAVTVEASSEEAESAAEAGAGTAEAAAAAPAGEAQEVVRAFDKVDEAAFGALGRDEPKVGRGGMAVEGTPCNTAVSACMVEPERRMCYLLGSTGRSGDSEGLFNSTERNRDDSK